MHVVPSIDINSIFFYFKTIENFDRKKCYLHISFQIDFLMLLLSLNIRSSLLTYNPFNPSKRHSILFLQRRILQKNLNLLNIREQEWNYFRWNKPFERNHSVRQTTVTSLTEKHTKMRIWKIFCITCFYSTLPTSNK